MIIIAIITYVTRPPGPIPGQHRRKNRNLPTGSRTNTNSDSLWGFYAPAATVDYPRLKIPDEIDIGHAGEKRILAKNVEKGQVNRKFFTEKSDSIGD